MAVTPWGDPTTESFRKKHIRESRVGGSVVLVNAKILAAATRLLEGLTELHVELPEKIPAFDLNGTPAQKLGLSIRLDIPFSEEAKALLDRWGFVGAEVPGETVPEFRFNGDVKLADEKNDEALAKYINRLEEPAVSGPSPYKWPGHRDLVLGDTGQDVLFLQLLFASTQSGEVDEDLIIHVKRFQERRGGRMTGLIDRELWRRIIPRRLPMVMSGEAGFIVRVLQAALVAGDHATTRVTGVYGVLTMRDVRALQKENQLRQGNFVRAPEWALILGPSPWDDEAEYEAKVQEAPPGETPPAAISDPGEWWLHTDTRTPENYVSS